MMNNQENVKDFINNMNENKEKPCNCTDTRHFPPPLILHLYLRYTVIRKGKACFSFACMTYRRYRFMSLCT